MRRFTLVLALLLLASTPVAAQVGHPPAASPFRDIMFRHGFSAYAGSFNGNPGTAGVGLQTGYMGGVRHDWRLTAPLSLTSRFGLVFSDRMVLDPSLPEGEQELGETSATVAVADVGFTFGITGARTWRRLAPVLHGGIGISSDLGASPDPGGFSMGTSLALSVGGGIRYVPDGNIAFRLDFSNHLLRYTYPQFFFTPPAGGAPILQPGDPQNEWRHNPAVTFGVTWMFGR